MGIKELFIDKFTVSGTYEFPEELQERIEDKIEGTGMSCEEAVRMVLELWTVSSSDIRKDYIEHQVMEIQDRLLSTSELKFGDTTMFYDEVNIIPVIDLEQNIFEIQIEYYLNKNKVATKVERPLDKF